MTTIDDENPEKNSVISQSYGLSSFLWPTVIQSFLGI